ncbi:MAG TPA: pseudouridine synthase, partial [Hymenobacter sp.]
MGPINNFFVTSPRPAAEPHRHFLIHKPYGYLSQFVGEAKKKKLGEFHDFPAGIMAIGRLDEDSEGLLLLTTDGRM